MKQDTVISVILYYQLYENYCSSEHLSVLLSICDIFT